jgi:hypothetical protein
MAKKISAFQLEILAMVQSGHVLRNTHESTDIHYRVTEQGQAKLVIAQDQIK